LLDRYAAAHADFTMRGALMANDQGRIEATYDKVRGEVVTELQRLYAVENVLEHLRLALLPFLEEPRFKVVGQ
jgi:hypothetical protein